MPRSQDHHHREQQQGEQVAGGCRALRDFSANSQAQITTKEGFRYSDGWKETPAR